MTVWRSLSKPIARKRNFVSAEVVFQRLHSSITKKIWRRSPGRFLVSAEGLWALSLLFFSGPSAPCPPGSLVFLCQRPPFSWTVPCARVRLQPFRAPSPVHRPCLAWCAGSPGGACPSHRARPAPLALSLPSPQGLLSQRGPTGLSVKSYPCFLPPLLLLFGPPPLALSSHGTRPALPEVPHRLSLVLQLLTPVRLPARPARQRRASVAAEARQRRRDKHCRRVRRHTKRSMWRVVWCQDPAYRAVWACCAASSSDDDGNICCSCLPMPSSRLSCSRTFLSWTSSGWPSPAVFRLGHFHRCSARPASP